MRLIPTDFVSAGLGWGQRNLYSPLMGLGTNYSERTQKRVQGGYCNSCCIKTVILSQRHVTISVYITYESAVLLGVR